MYIHRIVFGRSNDAQWANGQRENDKTKTAVFVVGIKIVDLPT
jgi:hypothetical protein